MSDTQQLCPFCNLDINSDIYHLHILQCSMTNLFSLNNLNHISPPNANSTFITRTYVEGVPDDDSLNANLLQSPLLGMLIDRFVNVLDTSSNVRPSVWMQVDQYYGYDEYEFNNMVGDMLGKVEVGFTTDEIDQLSDIVKEEEIKDDTCPICLESFIESKNQIRKLKCSHLYCDDCINQWLKKNKRCPCCQIDLEDVFLKKNEIKIEINSEVI